MASLFGQCISSSSLHPSVLSSMLKIGYGRSSVRLRSTAVVPQPCYCFCRPLAARSRRLRRPWLQQLLLQPASCSNRRLCRPSASTAQAVAFAVRLLPPSSARVTHQLHPLGNCGSSCHPRLPPPASSCFRCPLAGRAAAYYSSTAPSRRQSTAQEEHSASDGGYDKREREMGRDNVGSG